MLRKVNKLQYMFWSVGVILVPLLAYTVYSGIIILFSKVHGANMGPTWGRQNPGGPQVGHVNLASWVNNQGVYIHKCSECYDNFNTYRAILVLKFGIQDYNYIWNFMQQIYTSFYIHSDVRKIYSLMQHKQSILTCWPLGDVAVTLD